MLEWIITMFLLLIRTPWNCQMCCIYKGHCNQVWLFTQKHFQFNSLLNFKHFCSSVHNYIYIYISINLYKLNKVFVLRLDALCQHLDERLESPEMLVELQHVSTGVINKVICNNSNKDIWLQRVKLLGQVASIKNRVQPENPENEGEFNTVGNPTKESTCYKVSAR